MRRRRTAFTLVELLVVIGIIAMLIGILLAVLGAAREAGKRVTCMSNMRQITTAFLMYAQEHKFHLPRAAPEGTASGMQPKPHDWVHWNYGRDIKQSAIGKYVPGFTAGLLICPADPGTRLRDLGGWNVEGMYTFSYAMNMYVGDLNIGPLGERLLTRIRNSSEKILLVEEDFSSIDDGNWLGNVGPNMNLLSVRHDRSKRNPTILPPWSYVYVVPDRTMKGNAAFADGHVAYVERGYAHDPAHYLPK